MTRSRRPVTQIRNSLPNPANLMIGFASRRFLSAPTPEKPCPHDPRAGGVFVSGLFDSASGLGQYRFLPGSRSHPDEIGHMRRQILQQRKELQSLQQAGISARWRRLPCCSDAGQGRRALRRARPPGGQESLGSSEEVELMLSPALPGDQPWLLSGLRRCDAGDGR